MEKSKFEALLALIVPKVVMLIVQNHNTDEMTAVKRFYESKVYSSLEKEDTKLWHLSEYAIFQMYDDETKSGSFEVPEEA